MNAGIKCQVRSMTEAEGEGEAPIGTRKDSQGDRGGGYGCPWVPGWARLASLAPSDSRDRL